MKIARKGPTRRGSAETSEITEGSREDRLLDAARDLMIERDSIDITLGDVGRRAGVNHGLVGYYFGSKEGMFVALVLRHAAGTSEKLNALLKTSMSPLDKLRTHIAATLKIYDDCPILGTLLNYVLNVGTPEASARINTTIIAPMVSFYEKLVAEGVATGDFVKTDPLLLHLLVIGTCTSVHSNRARLRFGYGITQITRTFQEKYTDYVASIILQGIKAADCNAGDAHRGRTGKASSRRGKGLSSTGHTDNFLPE